jgi:hypothetical protein
VRRTATSLIIGIALGAATYWAYRRYQEVVHDNDPDAVMDDITDRLAELEQRLGVESRAELPAS